jgi:pSer/pThr/pTyr-binding forkhead associated (FHA) protein
MQFRLKVIKGKPRGHCLTFPTGEFMFGRGPECDIRPISDLVSRQHCLLRIADQCALIRDLGSRNGTLVNGKIVLGELELRHGDTVQIGPLVLEVQVSTEPVAPAASIGDTAMLDQTDTAKRGSSMGETCDQFKMDESLRTLAEEKVR